MRTFAESLIGPADHQSDRHGVAESPGRLAMNWLKPGTLSSGDPVQRRLEGAWTYLELDYSAVKYFRYTHERGSCGSVEPIDPWNQSIR